MPGLKKIPVVLVSYCKKVVSRVGWKKIFRIILFMVFAGFASTQFNNYCDNTSHFSMLYDQETRTIGIFLDPITFCMLFTFCISRCFQTTFLFHLGLSVPFIAGCPNLGCCGNSQSIQFGWHKNKQRTKTEVKTQTV